MTNVRHPKTVGDVTLICSEFVHPDHSIREVVARMRKLGVGFLPVVDGDEIVGVIDADKIVEESKTTSSGLAQMSANDILSTEFMYCAKEDDIESACAAALREGHAHLIVVDAAKQLLGSVSTLDLRRSLDLFRPTNEPTDEWLELERCLIDSGHTFNDCNQGSADHSVRPKIRE